MILQLMRWLLKQGLSFKIFKRYVKYSRNHEGRLSEKTYSILDSFLPPKKIIYFGRRSCRHFNRYSVAVKQINLLTKSEQRDQAYMAARLCFLNN